MEPLKRLHSDKMLESRRYAADLERVRRLTTGNTRIKVLEERGYNINDLPREIYP